MHPPALVLRLTRAIVGLVTVWCLGCSSYESILASILGTSAGMTCGSDAISDSDPAAKAAPSDGGQASVSISAPANERAYDCGCGGSCHAPSPRSLATTIATSPIPTVEPFAPAAPQSITRAPLLPPPEIAT